MGAALVQDALLVPGDLDAAVAPSARKVTARERQRAYVAYALVEEQVQPLRLAPSRKGV